MVRKSNKQSHYTQGRTPVWQYSTHHDQSNVMNKHLGMDACVYMNAEVHTKVWLSNVQHTLDLVMEGGGINVPRLK